jgi:hypothetical protein
MLSLTHDDMPNFTPSSPEDVREAQKKALNLWVGAMSPLWAPFWLASTVGIGVWAVGQGFKRAHTAIGTVPEPLSTDVAGTVQNMVDAGVIAPIQAAGKAIEDMTAAVTPSPQAIADQIKATSDDAVAATTDLAEVATVAVDETTQKVVETSDAQIDAAGDVAEDTGSLVAEVTPTPVPEAVKTLFPAATSAPASGATKQALKATSAVAAATADTAVAVADTVPPAPRSPKGPGKKL